ncbi:MAG: biosynthetic arginine decarboxylase [Spirochaetaceae bacterium]|nr:MAG: biosynthetic arginine decarboxylase [Spirochaetaceae bacterium]
MLQRWKVSDSAELYGIRDWGAGYFDVSDTGEVVIQAPFSGGTVGVNLMDVIAGITQRGLSMPVLLRVENLLDSQITRLNESFRATIAKLGYQGCYQGVFPIKVNQQEQVIKEISRFGDRYNHGLEAGSKAELIVALAVLNNTNSCLVCNGYKDAEFIDLGLEATRMGYKVFFVMEMPGELDLLIERSRALGIKPNIGVRLKLATKAGGHWSESGGDSSIFGLTSTQLVDVVDRLRAEEMLDCLRLVHYHLGSQIPNIRDIRSAIRETCRFYADLAMEGAPMGHIDLGGGLAVDYDGSKTNFVHSMNYSLDEYTADVIEVIMEVLDEHSIPHPVVITESGRSTVAYSSVLLFDVLDVTRSEATMEVETLPENSHELLVSMREVLTSMTLRNVQECYNDAVYYRDEIRERFKWGQLGLRERALSENLFFAIMRRLEENLTRLKRIPPALQGLDEALYDIYYGNFSVFQSLPDAWAIDQIFPVMPLHRLAEEPKRKAIIADITCDSDGKIDRFSDLHDLRRTLSLHSLVEGQEYYLGAFLVGAYQETLGDLHNLFGDTNIVGIRINADGSFDFVHELEGDSIADVVSYVEYDPKGLLRMFREKAEQAVRDGRITPNDRRRIVSVYEAGMNGYTYFER